MTLIVLAILKTTEQQIADAYWAFERPREDYRKRTGDRTNAIDCADKEIAAAAKHFLRLFEKWKFEHPIPEDELWGISPDNGFPQRFPRRRNA